MINKKIKERDLIKRSITFAHRYVKLAISLPN